ncbi:DegV family protein [Lachnospira pectinoschiza]|uniref:EDD domain protein, DegV family n=1 Tax=Lachnospira pectinoschiza TaxID=28052 RepID=A0A1G9TK12_9FIRM|nr:DegV family protein [Lachnospira pectinoschiza]SDM48003.1 EDD domain protein, DegV family [Lachnospira pectinoschiza]
MIKIISDITCDLSQELLNKYDIDILPLHVVMGEEEYIDGTNISPDEIYLWSDEHKETPKTSAVGIEEAINLFRKYTDAGDEIIAFAISEDMSTTANVMRIAAEELEKEDKIHVIDSMNLSTGVGHLVVEAAIMAKNGESAETIVNEIEKMRHRVRASFVIDTLVYLQRGGRCSSVAAIAGGLLKLHPKIVVENGKMIASKKYRGSIDSAILKYVADLEPELAKAKKDRVFITHSGCDEELIGKVREKLEALNRFDEILVTRAGSVISSHCGPGTLGVLFIEE